MTVTTKRKTSERETKTKAELVSVSIRLPKALHTKLSRKANLDNRTLNNYIVTKLEKID